MKLLVDEEGSEIAARLWDQADLVAASRLAVPEVSCALAAAGRAGRLDPAGERQARRDWEEFWSATRAIELTDGIATSAASLAGTHILGGADAVHLASVLTMVQAGPILVAWDLRLRTAALAAGLLVAPSRLES